MQDPGAIAHRWRKSALRKARGGIAAVTIRDVDEPLFDTLMVMWDALAFADMSASPDVNTQFQTRRALVISGGEARQGIFSAIYTLSFVNRSFRALAVRCGIALEARVAYDR